MLGDLPEDVEGGQIVRDAKGQPMGVFVILSPFGPSD